MKDLICRTIKKIKNKKVENNFFTLSLILSQNALVEISTAVFALSAISVGGFKGKTRRIFKGDYIMLSYKNNYIFDCCPSPIIATKFMKRQESI